LFRPRLRRKLLFEPFAGKIFALYGHKHLDWTMSNIRRILAGTAALVVGGFAIGALIGLVSSIVVYFPGSGWRILTGAGGRALLLRNAIIVGGITGCATPLLAWLGLRRVPIGRVIALGAFGAAVGALSAALLLGPIFPRALWGLSSPLIGAATGSLVVAMLLRLDIRALRLKPAERAV
jgi:hypothetical protein